MSASGEASLRVTVDEWTDDGRQLIKYHAKLESEVVGFATFDTVVNQNLTSFIRLRHGAMVLRERQPLPWQEAVQVRDAKA
jgi:hypothetical protein